MAQDALSRTAAAAGASQKPSKLNVFISYSRQDIGFVDRLQEALVANGIEASVDREHIEKGEEWWARITELITGADTIVFVLSPGSVNSAVCKDEVAFAERLNKRFVPVVARDLERRNVPAALARLNYIFFIPNQAAGARGDFAEAVVDLVRALQTDIPWIREHTRLGALAERWEARGRPSDLLLRGAELNAAEAWLTTRPEKAPDPTDAHRALVTLSRQAATRRQRGLVVASLVAGAVSIGLALYAFTQQQQAEVSRVAAEASRVAAEENRVASVRTLATSDFQRGAALLQSEATTAEGMAYLARSVREGQDMRAATRLWVLLQQRRFWLPKQEGTGTPRGLAVAVPLVPKAIERKFAKVTYGNTKVSVLNVAVSGDSSHVFTTVEFARPLEVYNPEIAMQRGIAHRVWKADGTPVTKWAEIKEVETHGLPVVHGVLSHSGQFLALDILDYTRDGTRLQIIDTGTGKPIGPDLTGTGFSGAADEAPRAFPTLAFLPPERGISENDSAYLLLVENSGAVKLYSASHPSRPFRGSNLHSAPVVGLSIDQQFGWLMSWDADGYIRLLEYVLNEEAIGNALRLAEVPVGVERVDESTIRVHLAGGRTQTFFLRPEDRSLPPSSQANAGEEPRCLYWSRERPAEKPTVRPLLVRSGEVVPGANSRELVILVNGEPRYRSPTFPADIGAVCADEKGDRLLVTSTELVTEVWAADFSKRYGVRMNEAPLLGSHGRRSFPGATLLMDNGQIVATLTTESTQTSTYYARAWDLATGTPLSDRRAAFHPRIARSRRFLGVGPPAATLWLDLAPPPGILAWIADLAEGIAGVRITPEGLLEPVPDRAALLVNGEAGAAVMRQEN